MSNSRAKGLIFSDGKTSNFKNWVSKDKSNLISHYDKLNKESPKVYTRVLKILPSYKKPIKE